MQFRSHRNQNQLDQKSETFFKQRFEKSKASTSMHKNRHSRQYTAAQCNRRLLSSYEGKDTNIVITENNDSKS